MKKKIIEIKLKDKYDLKESTLKDIVDKLVFDLESCEDTRTATHVVINENDEQDWDYLNSDDPSDLELLEIYSCSRPYIIVRLNFIRKLLKKR